MTDYPPMHPVSGYGRPKRRRVWPWLLLALIPILLCGGIFTALLAQTGTNIAQTAPGAQDEPQVAPGPQNSTPHGAAPKGKPVPKVAAYGAGTYSVPGDVKPGTYTTVVGDNDLDSCYAARLSKDGDPGSVILGGQVVLEHSAHGRLSIKASDKGVQFMGDCVWTRAK